MTLSIDEGFLFFLFLFIVKTVCIVIIIKLFLTSSKRERYNWWIDAFSGFAQSASIKSITLAVEVVIFLFTLFC